MIIYKYTLPLTLFLLFTTLSLTINAQSIDQINDDELRKQEEHHAEASPKSLKNPLQDSKSSFNKKQVESIEKFITNHCKHVNDKNLDAYMNDFIDEIKNDPQQLAYAKRALKLENLHIDCSKVEIQELFQLTALLHYRQHATYIINNEPIHDALIISMRIRLLDNNWKIYYSERRPIEIE